jgi:hypothetical protein
LVAVVPRLRDLVTALQDALREAQLEGWRDDTGTGEVHEAPEVDALWQATIALDRIAAAITAAGTEKVEQLVDALDRAGMVLDAVHRRLAELQTLAELAATEDARRDASLDTEALVARAQLELELPGASTATVAVTVDLAGQVAWRSESLDLADVAGVDQLAITTALRALGQALTPALPEPVFDAE